MERLRDFRVKHNYNFREMGEFLGISKTYYWQLEHGKRRLSYDMALKIAKIFDTTPDKIFYKDLNVNDKKNKARN